VRRRRRLRTAFRAALWCAVWLAGAAAAAFGFGAGWRLLTGEGRFPLDRIVVAGAGPDLASEIEARLARLRGRNLFTLDLPGVERDVESHAWVRSASVSLRLPGSLLVLVEPRRVEALVLSGSGVRMVDAEGADLGPYGGRHASEDHPVVVGLAGGSGAGAAGRLARALRAIRILRLEAPGFVENLSTLDVSRPDRITATLRDFRPPVHLSPEEPARNLGRLDAVRARLEVDGAEAAYVDLRFRDRVAVLPRLEGAPVRG
jgi:cell division septal protein FtsQ